MHLSFLLEPNIALGWIPTIDAQATAAALSVTKDLPRSSPTYRPRTHLRLVLGRSEYASAVEIFDGMRQEIPSKFPSQMPSEISSESYFRQPFGSPETQGSTAGKHFTLDDRVFVLTLLNKVFVLAVADRAFIPPLVDRIPVLTLDVRVLVLKLDNPRLYS
ncbi:hypothetical protein T069G_01975 [Trichoderma breve]|uniref:Uncharacterized protein n=1 Tax=Trichoderma breve TaxID=2034170 RepID=A0A9W9EEZ5_9HYPO|nr:hypothetical protein T069G_01975 [Trichoderma breve]KAJ4865445.1 hypothetical protein T069G_01975 [Trichoderma breve]